MSDKLMLKMERGRLVLELPQAAMDLEVNGALQATYFLGKSEGPEDLREELRKATAARSACSMLSQAMARIGGTWKTAVERSHFAEGLARGMRGDHHKLESGYHVPEAETVKLGPVAIDGWELGYAIRAAVAMSQTGIDPRSAS